MKKLKVVIIIFMTFIGMSLQLQHIEAFNFTTSKATYRWTHTYHSGKKD